MSEAPTPFTVCIVGADANAERALRFLKALEQFMNAMGNAVELVPTACCDEHPDAAAWFAAMNEIPGAYSSLEVAVMNERPDAWFVTTPPPVRHEQVLTIVNGSVPPPKLIMWGEPAGLTDAQRDEMRAAAGGETCEIHSGSFWWVGLEGRGR
jgi:hypothetical protein